MQRFLSLLPFLGLAAVAAILVVILFPRSSPLYGVYLPTSPTGIIERSSTLVPLLGVNLEGMTSEITLQRNQSLLQYLTATQGVEEANQIVRGAVPGFYWKVTWRRMENLESVIGGRSDEEHAEEVLDILKGELNVELDPSGHLIGIERRFPDTLALPTLRSDSARSQAEATLDRLLQESPLRDLDWAQDLHSVSESARDLPGHRLYTYLWAGSSRRLSVPTEVELSIAGNALQRLEVRYVIPEGAGAVSGKDILEVLMGLLYVIAIVAMIVSAIRIIRAYELGFRLAIVMGVITAAGVGYEIFLSMRGFGTQQLVSILLVPALVGGAVLLLWAVAESVTREVSREKFISLDLLTRGHTFHSYVGRSVVQGVALGLGAYAVLLTGVSVLESVTPVRFDLSPNSLAAAFPGTVPLLSLFAQRTYIIPFVFVIFVLFGISWLRARLPVPFLALVIIAALLGLANFQRMDPAWPAIALQAVTLGVVLWAFYEYDVLAGFIAIMAYWLGPEIMAMAFSGNTFYQTPAMVFVGTVGLVLVGGAAVQFRKAELATFEEITPAFAHNITERQRLQQELEIARRVQMSFLPKANPQIKGLEIAAQCVPAQEVGGDYFDFIPLGAGRLGIAIGDVSGKGTQAAFYMTLAKGFLKALSPLHESPAEVLSHLNKLFFENVDRGAFISMVYATVDVPRRTIQIARAGHNPVIMRKSEAVDVEVLQPTGLGLGLEAGETFARTIEEVSVRFTPGDSFVFYTDGFSEAMNKEKQEYGEEQLYRVINTVSEGTAQHILEEVFASVQKFAGKEKQHDDMTLVVLKITEA